MKNQKINVQKNQNTKFSNEQERGLKQNEGIEDVSIDEQLHLLAEIIIDQLIEEQNEKDDAAKANRV